MDSLYVLRYLPENEKEKICFLQTVYEKARTLRGARYHRHCNILATEGARVSARLRTWFHATDFFSNAQNLASIARYAITLQEGILMAKKTTSTKDFVRTEWKGFLDYRLSDAELQAAEEWELSDTDLVEGVLSLTAKGYKLTASYSAKTGAATATLMAGVEQDKLNGWALSARGSDARDAIKLLFFKHWHSLEEDWSELLEVNKPVARG